MNSNAKNVRGVIEISQDFYTACKDVIRDGKGRCSMEFVHYDAENSAIVATDGRRLIASDEAKNSDLDGMSSGAFQPAKIGKRCVLVPAESPYEFVNWKRVIPDNDVKVITESELIVKSESLHARIHLEMQIGCRAPINHAYMLPLYGYDWKITTREAIRSAIVCRSGNMLYIIMPMMTDEEHALKW